MNFSHLFNMSSYPFLDFDQPFNNPGHPFNSFPARARIHRSDPTGNAIFRRKSALHGNDVKLDTMVYYLIDQSLAKFQGDR